MASAALSSFTFDNSYHTDETKQHFFCRLITKGLHVALDECLERFRQSSSLRHFAAALDADLQHPDWQLVAGRVELVRLYRKSFSTFSAFLKYMRKELKLAPRVLECFDREPTVFDRHINQHYDLLFTRHAVLTLKHSYLWRNRQLRVIERPQFMWMRVALCLYADDLSAAFHLYDSLAHGYATHATPTLFNAALQNASLSSCYVGHIADDIQSIARMFHDGAMLSARSGGLGIDIGSIRHSIIANTGNSKGIVPMLRTFNELFRYIDQGGRRKGACCFSIPPWHVDVFDFLQMRTQNGTLGEEYKARDLFYALSVPDLFMQRVDNDAEWSLFCPHDVPQLNEAFFEDAFTKVYEQAEQSGLARKSVPARQLWTRILHTQIQTGMPFLVFRDATNLKSNERNVGVIRSANLCQEIMLATDRNTIGVCNLASIALGRFVESQFAFDVNGKGDFASLLRHGIRWDSLEHIVRMLVRSLNRVIDTGHPPVDAAQHGNDQTRPIGIGVQGFADMLMQLRLPFDSHQTRILNICLFRAIYYFAVHESCLLAQRDGAYPRFAGSPASQGLLQPQLWDNAPKKSVQVPPIPRVFSWAHLCNLVRQHGMRNSQVIALMPTASTASILRQFESFEPPFSNISTRRVLSGDFLHVNRYLVADLQTLEMWNAPMITRILAAQGSVQGIEEIPAHLRAVYKTAFEIPQRAHIQLCADRGPFVCQSQSMSLYLAQPDLRRLHSALMYAWKAGLKTGVYYIRVSNSANPIAYGGKVSCNNNSSDAAAACVVCSA